jgi:hypothetical protein
MNSVSTVMNGSPDKRRQRAASSSVVVTRLGGGKSGRDAQAMAGLLQGVTTDAIAAGTARSA